MDSCCQYNGVPCVESRAACVRPAKLQHWSFCAYIQDKMGRCPCILNKYSKTVCHLSHALILMPKICSCCTSDALIFTPHPRRHVLSLPPSAFPSPSLTLSHCLLFVSIQPNSWRMAPMHRCTSSLTFLPTEHTATTKVFSEPVLCK